MEGKGPEDFGNADDVWDEVRLEKSLKLLKEMHLQVSHAKALSGSLYI